MNKKMILALGLFVTISATAQLKQLTLEDAVTQQGRNFRADKFLGFQWVPNTSRYVYLADSGRKLMSAGSNDAKAVELVSLADVNKAIGAELRSFATVQWRNDRAFWVTDGKQYYEYDTQSKTGRKVLSIPEGAENAEFDESGSNLAFTDKNNLYILKNGQRVPVTNDIDEGIVSGQSIARNEFGIAKGTFWSPKSSYLAFYQKDQRAVADYPLLDITVTPGKLENIKYPMIGQTSEKPRVGIYNLASGKTVFISPKGNPDDYLTNLSWTPDEKYVLIAELNRGQNDMRLNLYEAATGNFVRTILQEKASTWVEPEHAAFFPSKTSNNFIWISEKDGFDNMYYYDLNGKLIKQLTANKFTVKEIVGASPKGDQVYFMATGPNPLNMLGYKVDLKGKQTLLTRGEGVNSMSISDDGNWIFDEYSNHDTPSKTLMIDKNGKATTLLQSPNKYEGYQIGTSEIKTIKAADGKTDLWTRLIKPSNFDPNKKYPVFVYVYGGPHAQLINNSHLDGANLWMYWLAEQGYLVWTVDNRGSAHRGRDFEHVIHGKLGEAEIADQLKGIDYLKTLPYVDANKLALHGWSYGGFMTTSMMLRHPGLFNVAIAGGPVTDWRWYEAMYGERYMDTPAENPKGFEENTVMKYAEKLDGKMLLIHGTSDDVVVMQHNLALVKKFVEAGKQVDFFPYPMHKHNVTGRDRVHLIKKVLDYAIENNK